MARGNGRGADDVQREAIRGDGGWGRRLRQQGGDSDPDRTHPPNGSRAGGERWLRSPSDERWPTVHAALTCLPLLQLAVLCLRDVEGWRPDEVCAALGLSGPQARMLLHRARTTVSQALVP